ncbi:hypothetical protein RUM44_000554 [Polyplax serrata]|uniref:Ionotropic receptor 40a n=1 Tax=Polyplax serrata TaxID=468196 RepID=A0ABR1B5S3_POLSC
MLGRTDGFERISRSRKIVLAVGFFFISVLSSRKFVCGSSSRQDNLLKSELNLQNGTLTAAIKDIILGLPSPHVNLLFDNLSDSNFPETLCRTLHQADITTSVYVISKELAQVEEQFCTYVRESLSKYQDVVNIAFLDRNAAVDLFWMLQQQDLIHRKVLYMFYWDHQLIESEFFTDHFEAMRIAVISSPRAGIFRVHYSQADPLGVSSLSLVNWWSLGQGLFKRPLLPPVEKVYKNFNGRLFEVPVIHKPPWNFVEYTNDSFRADGGRDDKLLTVMAEKLNFRYKYVDPPERLQGSGISENGTFSGVLGQVWQREVDFFMGDVTITYDRARAVEFSFFTLVDSEAFVTHRPSKLNEAFALVRPFQWQVWPPIIATFALYGPILFLVIELPHIWMKTKRRGKTRWRLLWDCVWFSTSTFLRQGGVYPAHSHKVRLMLVLVTLGATYVIGDMYSANLTSLLARPGREKPITVLEQLEVAMKTRGYELLVEKHSSSYTTLQNGTGIYERLWKKMQTQQQFVIESVESGMKMVKKRRNIAILGGRETLFFDTRRFGSYNFQLSEKLNTRYSAIAMQYSHLIVFSLMQLFECGILSKMTENEYERLGENQRAAANKREADEKSEANKDESQKAEVVSLLSDMDKQDDQRQDHAILGFDARHQLKPLSTRMLQGAFYILVIGNAVAGIVLLIEINATRLRKALHLGERCHWCCFPRNSKNAHRPLKEICTKYLKEFLNDLFHVGAQMENENDEKTTANENNAMDRWEPNSQKRESNKTSTNLSSTGKAVLSVSFNHAKEWSR